jgi:chromosome segregation ATPase
VTKELEAEKRQSQAVAAKAESEVASLQTELDEARQCTDVAEKRFVVLQTSAQDLQVSHAELLQRLKQATEAGPPPQLPQLLPQPQLEGDEVLLEGIESTRRALESELRGLRACSPPSLGVDVDGKEEMEQLEARHAEDIKRLHAATEELCGVRAELQAAERKLVELQQQRQQEASASHSSAHQMKRLQQQIESLEFERDSYKTELLCIFEAEQAAVAQRGGRVATSASPAKSASIVNKFVEANRELQAQCTDLMDKVRVLSEAAVVQSEEKRLWTLQLDQEKAHAQQFFAALQAAQLAMGAQDQDFLALQDQHAALEEECCILRERLRIYAPR